ncbi:MAG: sugar nucleotide-binding protein [Pseudomonadota bacterium]
MNILVLGGEGLLGHALAHELIGKRIHNGRIGVTVRGARSRVPLPCGVSVYPNVDATRFASVTAAIDNHHANAVINAIGIVKNNAAVDDLTTTFAVNAHFPKKLARAVTVRGSKLIHISTDCVFTGDQGQYSEMDPPDANDAYGRSKAIGEVSGEGILTLRTSMVGLEQATSRGLLNWFLSQPGPVPGYTNAVFSGPSAIEVARLVAKILASHGPMGGLMHVAAAPIDKFTLLTMVRDAFSLSTEIVADESVVIDRSMRAGRLEMRYGYTAPSWPAMVEELARHYHDAAPIRAAQAAVLP